jgi:tRNA(Ile)-lysidine synthase
MKLEIKPGKYIVAVSGGVDSMVLLHVLASQPQVELIVAHFDHGIRPDSHKDEQLVAETAQRLGLRFISEEGHLKAGVSEANARTARFAFLHRVLAQKQAQAVITAHHQDDVLETMIINMSRGTNRKGLSSLVSGDVIVRPLLHVPKAEILAYAQAHDIQWREDSTNSDVRYLRNYIRQTFMPKLSNAERQQLLAINKTMQEHNKAIDTLIADVLGTILGSEGLNRAAFIMLPHAIAREVMAAWLRSEQVRDVSSQQIERLVIAAKTGRLHAMYDVDRLKIMNIGRKFLEITPRDSRITAI